jgi:hypothetical protein
MGHLGPNTPGHDRGAPVERHGTEGVAGQQTGEPVSSGR